MHDIRLGWLGYGLFRRSLKIVRKALPLACGRLQERSKRAWWGTIIMLARAQKGFRLSPGTPLSYHCYYRSLMAQVGNARAHSLKPDSFCSRSLYTRPHSYNSFSCNTYDHRPPTRAYCRKQIRVKLPLYTWPGMNFHCESWPQVILMCIDWYTIAHTTHTRANNFFILYKLARLFIL